MKRVRGSRGRLPRIIRNSILLHKAFLIRRAKGGQVGGRDGRTFAGMVRGRRTPVTDESRLSVSHTCPSVVAPSRSDSGAHHEPHRLKQKRGKVGKTQHRFPIRDIREIRGLKNRAEEISDCAAGSNDESQVSPWVGKAIASAFGRPGFSAIRGGRPRPHPSSHVECLGRHPGNLRPKRGSLRVRGAEDGFLERRLAADPAGEPRLELPVPVDRVLRREDPVVFVGEDHEA